MLVGEKYVFLHFPKTGGTFVQYLLEKHAGKVLYRGCDHGRLQDLPREFANRFIFGFVRNPWEFYFSLFHFLKNCPIDYSYLRFCSNNYKDDFSVTIKKLLNPGKYMTREEYRDYIKYIMIYHNKNFHENDFQIPVEEFLFMEKNGIGFCSFMYRRMYYEELRFKIEDARVYKYERLKEVFEELSPMLGMDFDHIEDEFGVFLNYNHTKPKTHYSRFYDEELIELVRERDSLMIDTYNYTFEPSES